MVLSLNSLFVSWLVFDLLLETHSWIDDSQPSNDAIDQFPTYLFTIKLTKIHFIITWVRLLFALSDQLTMKMQLIKWIKKLKNYFLSHLRIFFAGKAQEEQVFFCLWKETFPHLLQVVCVWECFLPKEVVPFVYWTWGRGKWKKK